MNYLEKHLPRIRAELTEDTFDARVEALMEALYFAGYAMIPPEPEEREVFEARGCDLIGIVVGDAPVGDAAPQYRVREALVVGSVGTHPSVPGYPVVYVNEFGLGLLGDSRRIHRELFDREPEVDDRLMERLSIVGGRLTVVATGEGPTA